MPLAVGTRLDLYDISSALGLADRASWLPLARIALFGLAAGTISGTARRALRTAVILAGLVVLGTTFAATPTARSRVGSTPPPSAC